jgi:hypothetical protein
VITGYTYEVWKNGKQIGEFNTMFVLRGQYLFLNEVPFLYQKINRKQKVISFELKTRIVNDNGIDCTSRIYICANKKSKRQVSMLFKRSGSVPFL